MTTPTLRRGLPRVRGGAPWPPAAHGDASAPVAQDVRAPETVVAEVVASPVVEAPAAVTNAPAAVPMTPASGARLRRGLPRTRGGEPWPPVSAISHRTVAVPASIGVEPSAMPVPSTPRPPLPFRRTVFLTAASTAWNARREAPPREPADATDAGITGLRRWAVAVVGGGALLFAAAMIVLFTRWLVSAPPLQAFLAAYPGEYALPASAPVGFPAWLSWQHFFTGFFLVLIIRSGLRVRHEKRPEAFWSPRGNPTRKISLTLWFHQFLDVLWIANGVIFVVLLFVTGQWMRIVPTSWEVFPNALSAALQYVSLDWPTENGWVNYNSLQQLAYFTVVFVAAPLAIVTGVRLSGVWPTNARALSAAYPIEWARAVHFPVMLFFVAFIATHVFLVFATGALRNLNHMYAGQDSDGVLGLVLFAVSLVAIAGAWVAARPSVLSPLARVFGTVSSR